MKKIAYILLVLVSFFTYSCKNDSVYYEDEPFLHFPTSGSDQLITQGSGQKDVEITYGTISTVSGDSEVRLVVDPTSVAKEGIDFQIVKGTDNPAGKFNGKFVVRLLESGASSVAKKAIFRLQSNTIKNSVINSQTYTMTISLKCAATLMNANFKVTEAFWNAVNTNYNIVQSSSNNTLRVKDYLDVGRDLVLNYNPDTYIVTVPDQYTGSNYSAAPYVGTEIWVKATTDATQISSFNPCTKVLTIYSNYYLKGTTAAYGNKKEVFIGN